MRRQRAVRKHRDCQTSILRDERCHACADEAGGAGGIRTPDIRLAKAALSQLSYGPTACAARDSNPHPLAEGLSQLSYGPAECPDALTTAWWWAILDSNQGPQSYQDCALTT